MKNFYFVPWILALVGGAGILPAANLVESGDFSNSLPGTPFALTVGSNTVSGNISTPTDTPDVINVEVPVGHRLISATGSISSGSGPVSRSITFNGPSIFTDGTATPLTQFYSAGNYTLFVSVGFSVGNFWNTTFVVETLPDYQMSQSGSSLTITDNSGNGDTLTVASATGDTSKLLLSAPGRTFAFDDGPKITGSSGNLDLTGINRVTINTRDGSDTINVGTLPTNFPELRINGGEGDDLLQFSGTIDFATDESLDVNLTNEGNFTIGDRITVTSGAAITTTGTGDITLRCNQQVRINSGANLTTSNGDIRIEGNYQTTPNSGEFFGISIRDLGTLITSTGSGVITIKGRGGDVGSFKLGIEIVGGAKIIGGSGIVNIEGTGGSADGNVNRGITLLGPDTQVTSTGGDVNVTGYGGDSGSGFGIGIALFSNTEISTQGGGVLTVTGIGQGAAESTSNYGIEVGGENAIIKTGGGNLNLIAIDELNEETGLFLVNNGRISTPSTAGNIRIETTGVQFDGTSIVETLAPSGSVTIIPTNDIHSISLASTSEVGQLDINDFELDRIFTSSLVCETDIGVITLDGEISPANVDSFTVFTFSGHFAQSAAGGTIELPSGVFAIQGLFQQLLDNPLTHQPLVVNSELNLTEASLQASGSWVPQSGESIVLIENDAADSINGIFSVFPVGDLLEGELVFFGSSLSQLAAISYLGGSGNDVTLTAPDMVQVENNNDAGPGSLRQALVDATSPAYIDFDPEFFIGGENNSITLTGALSMPNKTLILDAQSAGGITLDGNQAGSVVISTSGGTITLDAFSITGGNSTQGGGISNVGSGNIMTLLNCSIFENTVTNAGGGILNFNGSILVATNCTIYDNHADGFGGGVENNSAGTEMTLTNCTIVGNSAVGSLGGLSNNGDLVTIGNTLIAHNTAPISPDIGGPYTSSAPNLIRDNTGSSTGFPVGAPNTDGNYVGDSTTPLEPLLVGDIGDNGPALINNGGPTPTILPLPGSPAIGKGRGSERFLFQDQRGESRFGLPDIGATQPNWGRLISVVAPPSAFGDLSDPTTFIEAFPTDNSPMNEGPTQAIDNTSAKHFSFTNINAGLDITPRIGSAAIVGLSIQIPNDSFFNRDPKTFLLLGTNDDWTYTPVLYGEIPDFASRGGTQTFYRSIQSQPYRSYRLIFPSIRFGENMSNTFAEGLAIAEVQLLGLPEDTSLRVLDCQFSPNVEGNHEFDITYTSHPSNFYQINNGATPSMGSTFQIFPAGDSFISTQNVKIPATTPKAFLRVEELITE